MFISSSKRYNGRFITEVIKYMYMRKTGWYYQVCVVCYKYLNTLHYNDFRPKCPVCTYEHNKKLLDYLRRMFCHGYPD
jgi:hypothetical protein